MAFHTGGSHSWGFTGFPIQITLGKPCMKPLCCISYLQKPPPLNWFTADNWPRAASHQASVTVTSSLWPNRALISYNSASCGRGSLRPRTTPHWSPGVLVKLGTFSRPHVNLSLLWLTWIMTMAIGADRSFLSALRSNTCPKPRISLWLEDSQHSSPVSACPSP
jgi:hypothetical protein